MQLPLEDPLDSTFDFCAVFTFSGQHDQMNPRRFSSPGNRPRQPFGRSGRASALRRHYRFPRKLLRDFALGAGMVVAMLGLAAAENRGWLGWIDRADAWVDGMRSPWSSDPAATPVAARHVPLCSPQYRRGGGGVTCVTDGDSGVADGEPWRLTARSGGVDAPEVGRPECAAERTAGDRATRRLQALMSGGYTMSGWGTDRHGRRLVTVTLADGRDAGRVLIDEGLAQPWPNSGNPWC